MRDKQRRLDKFLYGVTISGALMATAFLGLIMFYVFSHGFELLNLGVLTGDYHAKHYNARLDNNVFCGCPPENDQLEPEGFYSKTYGIALVGGIDRAGDTVIKVAYVHPNSPFNDVLNTNRENERLNLEPGNIIQRISFDEKASSLTRNGAQQMVLDLESGTPIREISFSTLGGGIRGSLITTLYLIGLTLLIALPVGIISAVYLNEFAPRNRLTDLLRSFIEMLTGVPSIIYGLIGLSLFVPLTVKLRLSSGASIYAGALTLAVILLPVIIRTTEEALKVIPRDYRDASFALGADKSQTVWFVVLRGALPGIMTAVFLSIGRIIGESAALIFVLGTAIKDRVSLSERSPSLAVHIWSLMSNEPANIELASTIAMIILMMVLVLNIAIKSLNSRLSKRLGG